MISALLLAWLSVSVALGPPRGSLLLAGGGALPADVIDHFIALAGGRGARIVVIPTAVADTTQRRWGEPFRARGARRIEILHTRDRAVADSDAFVAQIERADAVWFTGGRQWRIMDAYLNTRTHTALDALLARGGVIGGTSAGATAQGSLLVRGDTASNEILLGDHQRGFGWLAPVAIDQHLLARDRLKDMHKVLDVHPDVLGIGIDEGTALVVNGDLFEVLGRSIVAVYTADAEAPLQLSAGARYDMRQRQRVIDAGAEATGAVEAP